MVVHFELPVYLPSILNTHKKQKQRWLQNYDVRNVWKHVQLCSPKLQNARFFLIHIFWAETIAEIFQN